MTTFKSIKELKPYYNKNTNTYEFVENGKVMDVEFMFNLDVNSHIYAWNIKALDINAGNINAGNINARDINALDINARDINALDINAFDINAGNINAGNISYHAVCFAYNNIACTSIKGRRENAKHFILDGETTIKPKEQPKKKVTLELTDEQLEKVEELLGLKTNLILAYHTLDLNKWGEIKLTNLEHACWCKTRDDLIKQIKLKEKELEEMK